MRERALAFGSHRGLVGILTEPDPARRRPDAPAAIFANVGVHHRVGPFRMYVELARTLAGRGIAALRLNLSGLGESEARSGGGDERSRAVTDLREAMDQLEPKGFRRFVLIGFCSGVDPVHEVTRDDPRVAGAIYVDGYAYRTPGFYLRRYPTRALDPRAWRETLTWRLRRMRGQPTAEIYARDTPGRARCEAELQEILARDARLYLLFTAGAARTFNHPRQLGEMFPRLRRARNLAVELQPSADHLFSRVDERRQAIGSMVEWVARSF